MHCPSTESNFPARSSPWTHHGPGDAHKGYRAKTNKIIKDREFTPLSLSQPPSRPWPSILSPYSREMKEQLKTFPLVMKRSLKILRSSSLLPREPCRGCSRGRVSSRGWETQWRLVKTPCNFARRLLYTGLSPPSLTVIMSFSLQLIHNHFVREIYGGSILATVCPPLQAPPPPVDGAEVKAKGKLKEG